MVSIFITLVNSTIGKKYDSISICKNKDKTTIVLLPLDSKKRITKIKSRSANDTLFLRVTAKTMWFILPRNRQLHHYVDIKEEIEYVNINDNYTRSIRKTPVCRFTSKND